MLSKYCPLPLRCPLIRETAGGYSYEGNARNPYNRRGAAGADSISVQILRR